MRRQLYYEKGQTIFFNEQSGLFVKYNTLANLNILYTLANTAV